jgi:integral membrane protein (TIGR01906 family)
LANQSLSYLTNPLVSESHLEKLALPNKQQAYAANEIDHLQDVKHIVYLFTILGIIGISIHLVNAKVNYSKKTLDVFFKTVKTGFIFSLALPILIGIFSLIWWERCFILFHQTFFPQGNWTFPYDSTLIRLFPVEFWQLFAALFLGLIIILSVLGLLFTTHLTQKLQTRSETPNVPNGATS